MAVNVLKWHPEAVGVRDSQSPQMGGEMAKDDPDPLRPVVFQSLALHIWVFQWIYSIVWEAQVEPVQISCEVAEIRFWRFGAAGVHLVQTKRGHMPPSEAP